MITYALDTNIISYWLKGNQNVINRYRQENDKGNECVIPPVTYYEVKRGLLFTKATTKAKLFERLCQQFTIGKMNTLIWDEAARLYSIQRKQGRTVEDADLFIAAYCIVNDYTLVTNNTKHFEAIEGLQFTDWN